MSNGLYDLEGRCARCGTYHPCDCEAEILESQEPQELHDHYGATE